nr:unnamed protein product [Callosobruchus analis]
MNNGRSKRILEMCLNDNLVMLPTWETTKGLSPEDREPAMAGSSVLFEECEDSDIPSSEERLFSSDSDEDPTYIPEPDSNASDNDEYIPQPEVVILSDVIIKPGDPLQQSEQNKLQEVTVSPKDVQTKDAVSTCRELRIKAERSYIVRQEVQAQARLLLFLKRETLLKTRVHFSSQFIQAYMIAKKIICLSVLLRFYSRNCFGGIKEMLADQVSLKAKKDALICAYGSRSSTHIESSIT